MENRYNLRDGYSLDRKWSAPAGNFPGRGCLDTTKQSAKGPVSRILSCAVIPLDAALPRTFISDLPGGFGPCAVLRAMEHPCGAGQAPCASLAPDSCFPPYLVLLRVGFTLTPALTGASGALLPHHFTLTPARTGRPGEPVGPFREALPVSKDVGGVAEAVFFLWHWPSVSLEAHVPDVIRHTALRSSDFPLPADLACARLPAATARSSCQGLVYRSCGFTSCGRGFWRERLRRRRDNARP